MKNRFAPMLLAAFTINGIEAPSDHFKILKDIRVEKVESRIFSDHALSIEEIVQIFDSNGDRQFEMYDLLVIKQHHGWDRLREAIDLLSETYNVKIFEKIEGIRFFGYGEIKYPDEYRENYSEILDHPEFMEFYKREFLDYYDKQESDQPTDTTIEIKCPSIDVAYTVLREGPQKFQHFCEELRQNRNFAMEAVALAEANIRYAPVLWDDENVIYDAVVRWPFAIQFASDRLRNKGDFILKVIRVIEDKNNPLKEMLFGYVNTNLLADQAFAVKLLQINPRYSVFLSPTLSSDPEIQELAKGRDIGSEYGLPTLDDMLVANIPAADWTKMTAIIKERGLPFDETQLVSPDKFRAEVKKFTDFPKRFTSLAILADLMNRPNIDVKDRRPIALVIYPVADWNDAFAQAYILNEFVRSKKFQVVYKEFGGQDQLESYLGTIVASRTKIHTLIWGGHGSISSIQMGDSDDPLTEANTQLTLDDFEGRRLGGEGPLVGISKLLHDVLDPRGQVLLESCSNGSGGKTSKSMANYFRQVAPRGVVIYSTMVPSSVAQLEVNDDLTLSVKWVDKHPYTPPTRRKLRY